VEGVIVKARFLARNANNIKVFYPSNSTLNESKIYSQEHVMPGALLRNDPLFHKQNATWSYRVAYRMSLCDYFSGINPSHTIKNSNGTKRMDASGNYGTLLDDPPASEYDNSGVLNDALSRLNDNVRGRLDLSIALAESGKTARMIKGLGKVTDFAKANCPKGGYPVMTVPAVVNRHGRPKTSARGFSDTIGVPIPGKFRRLSDATLAIANGYLQYKYGWKQLMSDIFDVANESIRQTLNQLQEFSASAKKVESRGFVWKTSINGEDNVPVEINWDIVRKARYSVVLSIPDSSFDIARWTSLNPISLGWELIPYSFVVDWFVDVGSYLRNVETACYYSTRFVRGYKSQLSVHRGRGEVKKFFHISSFDSSISEMKGLEGQSAIIDFRRDVLTSYPTPYLPRFTVDLGSGQMASAAALLRQLLRKA
jgi:hypothetical protein